MAQYCVRSDLSDVISSTGVALRLDDAPPGSVSQIIDRASLDIEEYCAQRYRNLSDSLWVTKRCAELAVYYLCLRRGNPAPIGVVQMYESCIAKLERVQKGTLKIPRMVESKSAHPVMSNMRPTLRPYPHAVVAQALSTGTPEDYHQNRDPWDTLGMNNSWLFDFAF